MKESYTKSHIRLYPVANRDFSLRIREQKDIPLHGQTRIMPLNCFN